MKLSKKALITALLLVGCFATVFAQVLSQPPLPSNITGVTAPTSHTASFKGEPKSMTSESTNELFGTDVNDYLDVNEWSNVKPEKVFGFLSYETTGNGKLNFGVAVPVAGKFYLGTFFNGQVGSWESKRTTVKDGKTQDETTTKTNDNNGWSGSVLFGFDNIGIIGHFSYTPTNPPLTNNSSTIDKKNKGKKTDSKFKLETGLKAGMNIKGPNDMLFKTSAELALTSNVNKTVINNTSSSYKALKDESEYTLWLKGGVGFDFAHNGTVTQGANFALNTGWNIYPTTIYDQNDTKKILKVSGKLYDSIELDSAWQLTYEPEGGKVVLKAKVGVPVKFTFAAAHDYTEDITSTQTKEYNTARKYQTGINFTPTASLGLTYAPISKFRFNVGAKFNVPTFGWTIDTTKHRNSGDGKPDADKGTDKIVTWKFNTDNGQLNLGTGFTWLISQNITFDAYWDLTGTLTNFSINFSNPNIWDKLGKFIGTNIGFLLSVKL